MEKCNHYTFDGRLICELELGAEGFRGTREARHSEASIRREEMGRNCAVYRIRITWAVDSLTIVEPLLEYVGRQMREIVRLEAENERMRAAIGRHIETVEELRRYIRELKADKDKLESRLSHGGGPWKPLA